MLKLRINSFGFKFSGIPEDETGNGGGFVFDCRFIHNPGRYDEYKKFTGKDESVIKFLEERKETEEFLSHVFALVNSSIDNYLERNFDNLTVSFGCTGGRHRSVYSSERLAKHVREKYGNKVEVELKHIEEKSWTA